MPFTLALLLATFHAYASVRYLLQSYLPAVHEATRPLHPVVVAALPLWICWPDWILALGIAGAVGLLVAVVDRFLAGGDPPVQVPLMQRRSRNGGLPPLP